MSYATELIEGLCCMGCHMVIDGNAPGFPRTCEECDEEEEE